MRDLKTATPRTQIYVRLLQRKNGLSVAEMRDAIFAAEAQGKIDERKLTAREGIASFTPHNAYSLNKLAITYGQKMLTFVDEKGATRYMFRSEKNAETFDPLYADSLKMRASADRKEAKAEAEAEAERSARKAEREARKASKADAPPTSAKPVSKPRVAPAPAPIQAPVQLDNATVSAAIN